MRYGRYIFSASASAVMLWALGCGQSVTAPDSGEFNDPEIQKEVEAGRMTPPAGMPPQQERYRQTLTKDGKTFGETTEAGAAGVEGVGDAGSDTQKEDGGTQQN